MTLASIFFILLARNIIRVRSSEHILQNRNEVNNRKDITFNFNCNGDTDNNETCFVTLTLEKRLQEVTDQFSNLIKDHNATMVRIWLKFPEYEGFNPMLVNTSNAYGLWLWHWLYNDKGKSLLLLPHSAEFYSFGTLFLRGPKFDVLFLDNDGLSREIAHLPECCKLGLAARLIFKITNSSADNGQKDSNHLCHRYVDKPDTDDAEVKFRCCQVMNFWDNQDDCHEQIEGNKWINRIAIAGVILIVVLWVFVLPIVCWYIMPAAITEQPIVWKKFRGCKSDDTCRRVSDLTCEEAIYRKESDLVPRCTSQPVTIATISKYWRYSSQEPDETPDDSHNSQNSKCRSNCNLFKRLVAVTRFVLVVPVCVILLVIIGPIFLGFTDIEIKAWTMSTGFPAPNYEWGLFMPYPFETWRIVAMCTLYAIYSLSCAVFILMFGDTLGTAVCVNHQLLSCTEDDRTEGNSKSGKLFFSVSEKYRHFLDTVQYKNVQHLFVNVLFLIRKAQLNYLKEPIQTQIDSLKRSVRKLKWQTSNAPTLVTRFPPVTFFMLIYEFTKCCHGIIKKHNRPIKVVFTISFFLTVTLLAYFILLVSLWIVLYCFGFTLMGIALNPDKLAPIIVVVLTIFGYFLTVHRRFVKSYESLTKNTFEILVSKNYEDLSVEYVGDVQGSDIFSARGTNVGGVHNTGVGEVQDSNVTDVCDTEVTEIEDNYVTDVQDTDVGDINCTGDVHVTDVVVATDVAEVTDVGDKHDTKDKTEYLKYLVFRNVVYARSENRIDCILQDTLCFIFDKIQPVRHELGVALIKVLSLVVFIIFAFFVIQSFDVNPALQTALTAIVGAVPAVFKARGGDSSQTNATNDLLSCEIRCTLDKYLGRKHRKESPSLFRSQSAEHIALEPQSDTHDNSTANNTDI